MSARQPRPPCGTHAAYLAHVRYDEPRDQACLDARAAYDRSYRAARDPDVRRRTRFYNRARGLALTVLSRRYPTEYRALVRDELARLYAADGLAPNGELLGQTISQPDRRASCDHVSRGGKVTVKENPRTTGGQP